MGARRCQLEIRPDEVLVPRFWPSQSLHLRIHSPQLQAGVERCTWCCTGRQGHLHSSCIWRSVHEEGAHALCNASWHGRSDSLVRSHIFFRDGQHPDNYRDDAFTAHYVQHCLLAVGQLDIQCSFQLWKSQCKQHDNHVSAGPVVRPRRCQFYWFCIGDS